MYFISFEVLCELPADTKSDLEYLPKEVGIVEWSMTEGISNIYQKFSHSEEHQIPVDRFEEATDDYSSVWIKMKNFIPVDLKKNTLLYTDLDNAWLKFKAA